MQIPGIILLISLPLGITACSGDEISTVDSWSTSAQSSDVEIREIAQIDEIRSAAHEAYDRLVIVFSNNQLPRYDIRFIEEAPKACGSGHVVDIAAPEVLEIRLEPSRAHNDAGVSTLEQRERDLPHPILKEYVVTCDFEAVFAIVAGIDGARPFRVSEMHDPARIVIDVRHEMP